MYLTILFAAVATLLLLRLLLASPLGHAFVGIRENEVRMRAIGYPTRRYRLLAFSISGAVAGLAGGLSAIFHNFVSPDTMHWAMSAEVLVMVILGGAGTLIGPIIGAAVFASLKHFISSTTQHWNLIVGVVFIACVLFFPHGIYGTLRDLLGRSR
jgi:branched-chain amino acid transport system permease protein